MTIHAQIPSLRSTGRQLRCSNYGKLNLEIADKLIDCFYILLLVHPALSVMHGNCFHP